VAGVERIPQIALLQAETAAAVIIPPQASLAWDCQPGLFR
jgi:hypothetical protein